MTSLCSFTGTVSEPSFLIGSRRPTLRLSTSKPFFASASAKTKNDAATTPDKSVTFTGTAEKGVTLAITVGDYHNHADAWIAGNAIVSSAGALTVQANPLNAFNPSSTFGTNLAAFGRASSYSGTYKTTDGTKVLRANDTVVVSEDYPEAKGGGNVMPFPMPMPDK